MAVAWHVSEGDGRGGQFCDAEGKGGRGGLRLAVGGCAGAGVSIKVGNCRSDAISASSSRDLCRVAVWQGVGCQLSSRKRLRAFASC